MNDDEKRCNVVDAYDTVNDCIRMGLVEVMEKDADGNPARIKLTTEGERMRFAFVRDLKFPENSELLLKVREEGRKRYLGTDQMLLLAIELAREIGRREAEK